MSGFPIRCFSCNKVIGQHEQRYYKLLAKGHSEKVVLDKLGMNRYCCRRMFMGHVPILEQLLKFPTDINQKSD
jgi:DNA-directed RNA polymerase subunit N (RpoN/RPB10)